MALNYMALAVPLFLLLIGIEYWISKRLGRQLFNFNSSIANMNVGVAERLIDMFTAGSFFFFYDYLQKNYGLFEIRPTLLVWIALILATDFVWYWYHRAGHKINLFWGFHVVHHTSEEFNYTAGTRITIFQAVVRTAFWSVLPLIGFPAPMITTMLIVHGLYPFFTHTQVIGKLGILEYILVTPSHHRVHHASNEAYLDKNFGDMFIIWDKLFGTFAEEKEQPVFGLTKQLDSYSFLWQHFHFLVEIWYSAQQQKGIIAKLKVIFGSPENFDPTVRRIVEKRFLSKNKVRVRSQKFRRYVLVQFTVTVITLFFLLLFEHQEETFLQVMVALVIFVTLINCGAILEQRRWVFYLEFARGALVFITAYHYFPHPTLLFLIWAVLIGGVLYFSTLQKQYLQTIYGR
ncbi:sterol desaturase family protein [Dyadobacter jiangsuensis]|uniref:Sterol desaturase/sphingolipid hydroxylase (Fatty acid hydroxylase superfamily) n=1 Tax=Dyadobacter jiangsuensis TaxID=1591085 RepID=A0A2P8GFR8_9BACT|nr:sterol desaturase family protein [Dyadobacter jiangsuensis]PSL32821.1 sterol desaturase/sphingolipid hydroxylase (fatty acid hydroxylase superfamily) [Dyadobacter jiangsuensis]